MNRAQTHRAHTWKGAALFAALTLLAQSASAFQFGIGAPLQNGGNETRSVQAMHDAGLNTLRAEVSWSSVQGDDKSGNAGFTVSPKLQSVDKLVDAARAAGIRPLIILAYGSRAYPAEALYGGSEEGRQAFAQYADFLVRHFGDRVDQYEVWNEWNAGLGAGKSPRPKGDPAIYVQLLKEAQAAIKKANPKATVVGGSVAGMDMPWIDGFLKAGGAQYMDAFSVHPYMLFSPRPTPERAMGGLDTVIGKLAEAAPGRQIPIFITEMGWPTNNGKFGVSEDLAADYLSRFVLLARSRPAIGGIWWYSLVDDGDNDTEKEHRFGVLRRDYSPKPAYKQIADLSPIVTRGSDFRWTTLPDSTLAVTARLDGGDWLMAWKDPGGTTAAAAPNVAAAPDAGAAGRAKPQSAGAAASAAADLAAVPGMIGSNDDARRPQVWKRTGDQWQHADRPQ